MKAIADVVTGFVGLSHIGFLVLEMFFWDHPVGRRIFGMTPEVSTSAVGDEFVLPLSFWKPVHELPRRRLPHDRPSAPRTNTYTVLPSATDTGSPVMMPAFPANVFSGSTRELYYASSLSPALTK